MKTAPMGGARLPAYCFSEEFFRRLARRPEVMKSLEALVPCLINALALVRRQMACIFRSNRSQTYETRY